MTTIVSVSAPRTKVGSANRRRIACQFARLGGFMPVVSIYNNKGGVGKSTLTVGLAEFLAANRKRSVLVIDMDAQSSSSGSLLGRAAVSSALDSQCTIARLAEVLIRSRKIPRDLAPFVTDRPASAARGTALERLGVLVPDKAAMIDLEEKMVVPKDILVLRDILKPALSAYEFVLIDLPGNIDRRCKLAIGALAMSDFVLIPVEPSQIALGGLPDTLDTIQYAKNLGKNGRPAIVGFVLNKTDRRTEQYRSKFPAILDESERGGLPPFFENIIPDTPKLTTATDETHDFSTLKERFDTYYGHVRLVAKELETRCQQFTFTANDDSTAKSGTWFRRLFNSLSGGRKPKRPAAV